MQSVSSSDHKLEVLSLDVQYIADPTQVYSSLCQDKKMSLLLEGAEINSKQNLTSLMLIDAAIRIHCLGNDVILEALTKNGEHLLHLVSSVVPPSLIVALSKAEIKLKFSAINQDLDEDSRLQEWSPFDALRFIQQQFDLTDMPTNSLFLGGLFAYDLVANFEQISQAETIDKCPDYVFYVAESLLIIDHQAHTSQLQGSLFNADTATKQNVTSRLLAIKERCQQAHVIPQAESLDCCQAVANISDEDFSKSVLALKEFVIKGEVFQVVPSRRFTLPCPAPLAAYRELKMGNPSPYMFYLQDRDFTLFGASPESALKYSKQTNQVEIYPIAGTRKRGKNIDGSINHDLDSRIELELRCDNKENAEHMMLVDLARNDIARISNAGSRYVADLLKVDRYSHVMHLVSRVVGQLRDDLDALHAYQACMNMGTLTGAPKIRAMQLIREVEKNRRGSYGGAVGYLTGDGSMDTCIVIRSAYIEDGVAQVQAGAGVVYDSDPQAETEETRSKAQAVINAIQKAHLSNSIQGDD